MPTVYVGKLEAWIYLNLLLRSSPATVKINSVATVIAIYTYIVWSEAAEEVQFQVIVES